MSLLRPVGDREFSWFLRNASFITFRSRGWTSGRMRVHYSLKRWRRSNWRTPKIHTPNTEWSCFPRGSVKRFERRKTSFFLSLSLSFSVVVSQRALTCQFWWSRMIESGSVSEAGPWPRIRWNPVQDWFRIGCRGCKRAHRSTARISVACKLHFITCYPRAARHEFIGPIFGSQSLQRSCALRFSTETYHRVLLVEDWTWTL